MTTQFGKWLFVGGVLLMLGGGCATKGLGSPVGATPEGGAKPVLEGAPAGGGAVQGASDTNNFNLPDGKGPSATDLCVRTDGVVAGDIWLYAANQTKPRENWIQWYSAQPVVVGNAAEEQCGQLNFAVEAGDSLVINGSWQNGAKQLVWDGGSGPVDAVKEMWINDQYYAVGKECAYQADANGRFSIACTLR